jgi:dTMP kinase
MRMSQRDTTISDVAEISGVFITLEGGEGCGKSTQSALLRRAFEAAGLACLHTREPGGTPAAESIRPLLVATHADQEEWNPLAETLLFQAARVQHIEHKLKPALSSGTHIICDRFVDSTRVYQGLAKGLGISMIDALHAQTTRQADGKAFLPDITFILDIPAEIGLARATARGGNETRFEQEAVEFHHRLRDGFLALAGREPERIVVLDAQQSAYALHEQIVRHLVESFGLTLTALQEELA